MWRKPDDTNIIVYFFHPWYSPSTRAILTLAKILQVLATLVAPGYLLKNEGRPDRFLYAILARRSAFLKPVRSFPQVIEKTPYLATFLTLGERAVCYRF